MIQSFGDQETCDLFVDGNVPKQRCGWANVAAVAKRKLNMVHAADRVNDLLEPPGNRLEGLEGRDHWYSIRINNQWRIHFRWSDEDQGPEFVEITDHHD